MKRLGFVSHISKRGRIIVKAETIPKLNSEVIDKDKKPIGIVIDLMGPVNSPFVAVKPYEKPDPEKIKNAELFLR
ncbi:MAG TPA: Gar1/Naf1 family protein [Geobacterales bacterium]|nr:Gar1/Naf1 family protein [Geobacterales bacterium]